MFSHILPSEIKFWRFMIFLKRFFSRIKRGSELHHRFIYCTDVKSYSYCTNEKTSLEMNARWKSSGKLILTLQWIQMFLLLIRMKFEKITKLFLISAGSLSLILFNFSLVLPLSRERSLKSLKLRYYFCGSTVE